MDVRAIAHVCKVHNVNVLIMIVAKIIQMQDVINHNHFRPDGCLELPQNKIKNHAKVNAHLLIGDYIKEADSTSNSQDDF